jgi:hypothetical protein
MMHDFTALYCLPDQLPITHASDKDFWPWRNLDGWPLLIWISSLVCSSHWRQINKEQWRTNRASSLDALLLDG